MIDLTNSLPDFCLIRPEVDNYERVNILVAAGGSSMHVGYFRRDLLRKTKSTPLARSSDLHVERPVIHRWIYTIHLTTTTVHDSTATTELRLLDSDRFVKASYPRHMDANEWHMRNRQRPNYFTCRCSENRTKTIELSPDLQGALL